MMSLNDNEKDFQKKLQEETEIPVIVHERVNQAYRLIENNTAVQKKAPKEPYFCFFLKFFHITYLAFLASI